MKKNKIVSILIILLFITLVMSAKCSSRNTAQENMDSSELVAEEDKIDEHDLIENIAAEDTILYNGIKVGANISKESLDIIIRYFESIRTGDLLTFRSLLEPEDGSDIYSHLALMQKYFEEIVGVDIETLNDAVYNADESLQEMFYIFHRKEYPRTNRNTGQVIKEITEVTPDYDFPYNFKVITADRNHIETTHLLIVTETGINRHGTNPLLLQEH